MTNICEMYKSGIRTIALDQSLVGRTKMKLFTYGETVYLKSDNQQCEGLWQIEDTMNKRYNYKKRGDLFFINEDRHKNTSCYANIYKIGGK